MRRAQNQAIVFLASASGEILRGLRRLESEGGEKSRAIGISRGDGLELIEIGKTRLDPVVALAKDVVIEQPNARNVGRNLSLVLNWSQAQPVEQIDQRRVRRSCPRRRVIPAKSSGFPGCGSHRVDRRTRCCISDPGKQEQKAVPTHFVPRIFEDTEKREHVLYVRGFQKLEPAPLLEWNLAVGELDLEIGRHVACAEEDSDLAKAGTLLVQLEDPVDHESGLLLLIARGDQPRRFATSALRPEILGESLRCA